MNKTALYFAIPLALAVACAPLSFAAKPNWRMVYDNDTTNLLNCDGPFRDTKTKRVFTEELLRASVREAAVAGMDAQILSPGLGWVPWWKSDIVPLDKHEKWFEAYYGKKPDVEEHAYLLAGGDMVNVFADECHKHKQAAIISYRLNDSHFKEFAYKKKEFNPKLAHCISQFYVEHPEYRRYPVGKEGWGERVHNWAIPAARQHKLDIVCELIRNYPAIDGVELDVLRAPNYFPDDMGIESRVDIMVGFIKSVRAQLDAMIQQDGKLRYLGVRVHTRATLWKEIGFEPTAWANAGVDFFNMSRNYNTAYQYSDIAQVRERAPDAAIYGELTHTAYTWKLGGLGYDDHQYRRMTNEMLASTARLDYARGADGVSFFNFAYYRGHGGYRAQKGPFNEPPFAFLPVLADKAALEKVAVSDYFWEWGRDFIYKKDDITTKTFWMDMLPLRGEGQTVLRLLVLTRGEAGKGELAAPEAVRRDGWRVTINGTPLTPVENVWNAYPYPTAVKAGFNKKAQYAAFAVPKGLLKDGYNRVEVTNAAIAQDMVLRVVEIFKAPQ